jgi:hypothetical protein
VSLDVFMSSYKKRMSEKITNFSSNASVRKVLEEKVNLLAQKKFQELKERSMSDDQVRNDFDGVVEEFQAFEKHAFSVLPPPKLCYKSLSEDLEICRNQSILRHSDRSIEEVMLMAKVFGATENIRGIVPLKIERLVTHNLARKLILNFCLKGELSEELKRIVKPISKRFFEQDRDLKKLTSRKSLESQALLYLEKENKETIDPKFQEIIETLKSQALSKPSSVSKTDLTKAVAMRAADLIVEASVKNRIDEYDMSNEFELKDYPRLPLQTKETRRMYMINGGVASGKSSAKKSQEKSLEKEGVLPSDMLTLNRDAFKPMLLGRDEVEEKYQYFFASFTEDEAYLLRDAVLREYRERLKKDTAPHLYVDQVFPTTEMLCLGGDSSTQGLDVTIVHAPVELSFCFAGYREGKTQYGAVTEGLLNSHANIAKQGIENIQQALEKGKKNIRLWIVSNVAKDQLLPVAFFNYAKKESIVYDQQQLRSFFHKQHVNCNAKKFEEIYSNTLPDVDHCKECSFMTKQWVESVKGKY